MHKLSLFIIAITICVSSCSDNLDPGQYDCNTQIDKSEYKELEKNCRENKIESIKEIEENLIGKWQLVGIKSGWVDTLFYECLVLEIEEDLITVRNIDTGEVKSSEWKIESWVVNVYTGFYLSTNEDGFNNRIGMETFSKDFMFGTGRVDDGSSYLYKKLE